MSYDNTGIFEFDLTENSNLADSFKFTVNSYANGYEITDKIDLVIKLKYFENEATAAAIPFSVTYRICRPSVFEISAVANQVY